MTLDLFNAFTVTVTPQSVWWKYSWTKPTALFRTRVVIINCYVYVIINLSAAVTWAVTCDFQQCGNLTSVDSDEPEQPPLKLRNSKWCSVSSLTLKEYPSNKQRVWSDYAYAQADLRLCWSHIQHCWKSHALAHMYVYEWLLHVWILSRSVRDEVIVLKDALCKAVIFKVFSFNNTLGHAHWFV